MFKLNLTTAVCCVALLSACGTTVSRGGDSGVDAGDVLDASVAVDAGIDAGVDGGFDAGTDAGTDGGNDGGVDGGLCGRASPVANEAQLLPLLASLTWTKVGPYTNTRLPLSDEIPVTSTLTVAAAPVPVPASCASRMDCRKQVGFNAGSTPGVTCKTPDPHYVTMCAEVQLAPGIYRFRALLADHHPSQYNFVPVIEILPGCDAECAPNEQRCAADHTCWGNSTGYCLFCLALEKESCACMNKNGPLEEGAFCSYAVSGDVLCSGTCEQSRCEYNGPPGHAGCN